jgi:hypothetical protein
LEDDNGPYNHFNGREADIWFDVQLGYEACATHAADLRRRCIQNSVGADSRISQEMFGSLTAASFESPCEPPNKSFGASRGSVFLKMFD